MNRRSFLQTLGAAPAALALTGGAARASAEALRSDLAVSAADVWQAWKEGYLLPDGRIVDRLQQQASHSEGQGYGMLLATEFGDAEAFSQMLAWTEAHLAIRPDPLLAWRWLPGASISVPDTNNASDGDLFFAWALVRASRRFGSRAFLDRATATAQALVRTCLIPNPERRDELLFLPAAHGFAHEGRAVFNPSYLMPLAMREIAAATGAAELALAAQHGEALLLRLAQEGLVPDWVEISRAGAAPAEGFSANAGYDAIQVPLFLIWSGMERHPAVTNMRRIYERTLQPGLPVPTSVEPASGVVLEASGDPGYRALAGLVTCAGRPGQIGAQVPPFDASQPYYPATLQMFAMIAANQVTPQCVPV